MLTAGMACCTVREEVHQRAVLPHDDPCRSPTLPAKGTRGMHARSDACGQERAADHLAPRVGLCMCVVVVVVPASGRRGSRRNLERSAPTCASADPTLTGCRPTFTYVRASSVCTEG